MRRIQRIIAAGGLAAFVAAGAGAQTRTIDPDQAGAIAAPAPSPARDPAPRDETPPPASADIDDSAPPPPPAPAEAEATQPRGTVAPPAVSSAEKQARDAAANTYKQQDVLTAAEGVFGKGAAGLAGLIEKIFKDQGSPTAYIAGREAGGAFIVGVRYGSGTLFHKIEGQRPVYWTGPSLGLDLGANGAKTFVLAYNLYDSQELYRRFPAAEGDVYIVGGFTASYLRWKDVVLIPIRLGVGWRLGANVGYMKFSEKPKWSPF